MPSSAPVASSGSHETEALIRHAAETCERAGIEFRPARTAKLIRRLLRDHTPETVRRILDRFVVTDAYSATWNGFELYALGGYADPTGATAAHRVDLERRVLRRTAGHARSKEIGPR